MMKMKKEKLLNYDNKKKFETQLHFAITEMEMGQYYYGR